MDLSPIGWFLVVVVPAVFILTSIALLLIGVMKKNKTALIASAIVFAILIVGVLLALAFFTTGPVTMVPSP